MINMKEELVAGTRGSALARAQTQSVIDLLQRKNKGLSIKTKVIKTSGDDLHRKPNSKLTGKDSFTREIDFALIKGEIDFAVHSLKDVPVEKTAGLQSKKLEIAAFPKRESPYDVLIPKNKDSKLESLRENARVGTSSLRRGIQLKLIRPDLEIVEIHGNVPTRIKKMRDGEYENLDAIVLAEAGLKRLNIRYDSDNIISSKLMLPAIGQGCLAVTVRSKDYRTRRMIKSIDDKKTRLCVTAERSFSKELGGGCNTPIAALATFYRGRIRLEGLIVGESKMTGGIKSKFVIRNATEGKAKGALNLGRKLAQNLKAMSK